MTNLVMDVFEAEGTKMRMTQDVFLNNSRK
jgi:hypothetical protein